MNTLKILLKDQTMQKVLNVKKDKKIKVKTTLSMKIRIIVSKTSGGLEYQYKLSKKEIIFQIQNKKIDHGECRKYSIHKFDFLEKSIHCLNIHKLSEIIYLIFF